MVRVRIRMVRSRELLEISSICLANHGCVSLDIGNTKEEHPCLPRIFLVCALVYI